MPAAPLEGPGVSRSAPTSGRRAALRAATGALGVLAERVRPTYLAGEEILPAPAPLAELLGTPGLRRGSTLLVEAAAGLSPRRQDVVPGATSLALGLLAEPSAAGAFCAVVGLPDLGLAAARELGVALERLVVVPSAGPRDAAVVGALLEGVDLVLARLPGHLSAATARRLTARAREHRSVLVLAGRGVGEPVGSGPDLSWPEPPDVRFSVLATAWDPTDAAGALFASRRLEVRAHRRRAVPEDVSRTLAFSAVSGRLRLGLVAPEAAAAASRHPERREAR